MAFRSTLMLALAGTLLAGCAQVAGTDGISTGSIAPSLASITSMLPSASSLLPSLSTNVAPQKAERIGTNLYRVYSSDRPSADRIEAENYALLRAAETTKDAGATHFIVVDVPGQSSTGLLGTGGPSSQTANLIRVLKLDPGSQTPIGAVSADEIIHFFGPAFSRETPRPPA